MKRMTIILFMFVASLLPPVLLSQDIPGYIGPPVVVRLCQIFPRLCER